MTTAKTATAPKPRQPRPKPARFASWLRRRADGSGVLSLTVGKLVNDYFVNPLPADWGTAFRLEKFGSQGGEVYLVNLDRQSGRHSCDCPGGTYHGHCKHVEALLVLTAQEVPPCRS
jgi:hypothetical protein